jgi:CBS-domain-containing membrane protein
MLLSEIYVLMVQ